MGLLKRKTVLAAATEATPYTAETLGASDSNFNVYDLQCTASIETIDRPTQDSFSSLADSIGLRSGTFTFKTELYGDGAGGVPAWASTFFPAVGLVNSSGTFGPSSVAPDQSGASTTTLTMAAYEDGRRKIIRGAMGNCKLVYNAGKVVMLEWEFQGAWGTVTDATLLTPTYPTRKPIRFANSTLSIGGTTTYCVNALEVDLGNVISLRECQSASDASGYKGALVTNRNINGTVNPEAELVATYDPHGDWVAGTERALVATVADAQDTITLTIPKYQITNVTEGDRGGQRVDQISWQGNRSSAADDELTIAFAATV